MTGSLENIFQFSKDIMFFFFLAPYCACTALVEMGYFQSWIDQNKLPHNFLESSPLVEQCMADSIISDGPENEEVAD